MSNITLESNNLFSRLWFLIIISLVLSSKFFNNMEKFWFYTKLLENLVLGSFQVIITTLILNMHCQSFFVLSVWRWNVKRKLMHKHNTLTVIEISLYLTWNPKYINRTKLNVFNISCLYWHFKSFRVYEI